MELLFNRVDVASLNPGLPRPGVFRPDRASHLDPNLPGKFDDKEAS